MTTLELYLFAAIVMAATYITWFCLKLSKDDWINYTFLVFGLIKIVLIILDAIYLSQVSVTRCTMECIFTGVIVFNAAVLVKWKYCK